MAGPEESMVMSEHSNGIEEPECGSEVRSAGDWLDASGASEICS